VGRNITEAQYKVLLMFAAAGILFELFWLRRIPELPDASLLADPGSERRGRGHLWRVVKSARVLRWPLLAQVLWHLSVTPVGVLYFKRMLHVPSNVIALQQLMAMLGSIVSFAVWGRIADALGFRPLIVGLLIMAILVAPVIMLAAPLPDPLPDLASLELSSVVTLSVVLLLGLINGALSGGIGLALTSIQHFFTRRKNALEEMNIYLICVHLATALSVLVTGWLLEEVAIPGGLRTFGNNVLHWDWFRAYLVIVKPLLYTGLIAIVLRLPNTKPFFGVWDFFSSLFDGPVRIMMAGRRVYDGAEEQRISLARLHARRINPLHIETLLELSEDPSYDVRVEAIRALGTTRSNLAGDRLLTMLNDVTEDQVADQVAWSLGELGYQPAFDALVARLDSGYPTRTRAMAARALGKLGDKRAVPFLVEQITREERSLHLIASCNKALLRLEDSTHANLVFESLERLTNRVERYEMMALICEWLGISSQWLVRSSSQESWRDALLAETASRSVCWKESHRGVISALERRDSSGMAEQVRARAGTLQGAAAEIVDALADALGDNLRWNSLSVLGAAWLMFDGE